MYSAERVLSYFPFTAHLHVYIRQNKVQVIVVLDFYIHTVVIVIIIQYYIKQLTSVCNQYRTMRHAINSSSWLRLSSHYGILLHTLFSMFIFFLIICNLKKFSNQNMIPELLKYNFCRISFAKHYVIQYINLKQHICSDIIFTKVTCTVDIYIL